MIQEVSSARLLLRPLDAGDLDFYCSIYCNPEMTTHTGPVLERAVAERAFGAACRCNSSTPPKRWFWVYQIAEARTDIGLLGMDLHLLAPTPTVELGVMTLPAWQSRGFAAEALMTAAAHAFEHLGIELVTTRHEDGNAPAEAIMHRLGFEARPASPERSSHCQWQLRKEVWQTRTMLRNP